MAAAFMALVVAMLVFGLRSILEARATPNVTARETLVPAE